MTEGQSAVFTEEIISPIVAEGDVIGAVVLLMKEETKRTEDGAEKLALAAAAFLGKQMEF